MEMFLSKHFKMKLRKHLVIITFHWNENHAPGIEWDKEILLFFSGIKAGINNPWQ